MVAWTIQPSANPQQTLSEQFKNKKTLSEQFKNKKTLSEQSKKKNNLVGTLQKQVPSVVDNGQDDTLLTGLFTNVLK